MALLASLFFGERLSAVGYGGLVAGVAGLCLLELPPAALQALVADGPAGGVEVGVRVGITFIGEVGLGCG